MTSRFRTIDLFCGAGGSSYGARNAGVEIVAGLDSWKQAVTAFKANFPTSLAIQTDIRTYSPKTLKDQVGEIDLILASPECTNHSRAKGAAERSEDSRETAFQVIRYAKAFQPKWVVIENVVDMQSWDRYPEFLDGLRGLDLGVREVILNAKDFGVPQSRERLFILASTTGESETPTIIGHLSRRAVRDVLDPFESYTFSLLKKEGRAQKTIESANRAMAAVGVHTPFLLVYYGAARSGNGGWQKIDEPLRTITTLDRFAYVTPGQAGHLMRMLQPKELKLAMGYGADFKLESIDGLNRRDRIKLMGNGVCPPVMKAIVESLIR